MKKCSKLLIFSFTNFPFGAWAADADILSPSNSALKMIVGLMIVLAVMALITWALKRMVLDAKSQQSIVRIVGGVSVGSRERVVVVEVANRWIVVGVAPGQVNGIANFDMGNVSLTENAISDNKLNASLSVHPQSSMPTFAQWLKKSTAKFIR